MKILSLLINEDVLSAERAFELATSDNVVDLCRDYLRVLSRYRQQLLELRDIPEINLKEEAALGRELIVQSRKAVRAAIEMNMAAHDLIETLLNSLTLVNARDAAETFNQLVYRGSTNWEMRGQAVCVRDAPEYGTMTIEEAVETARRLRREAYVANRITFFRTDSSAAAG